MPSAAEELARVRGLLEALTAVRGHGGLEPLLRSTAELIADVPGFGTVVANLPSSTC